ncbi:MAG: PorV/PorQ family protein, partial [Odoribacteraceae bacterium]|nr:PorV/PorQ family protein [Odoribacteraceae bacterium]
MKRLVVTAIAILVATSGIAQTSAPFLLVPVDARASGMGGGGIALPRGPFIAFRNPAAIPFARTRAAAGDSHTPWLTTLLPGSFLNALGGYYYLDEQRGALAAGFRYFAHPRSPGSNDNATPAPDIHPAEWAAEIAYARRLPPGIGISLTGRYIHSDMGARAANAVAFDAGLFYRSDLSLFPRATWSAAFTANDIGTKIKYNGRTDNLPARLTLGGAISVPLSPFPSPTLSLPSSLPPPPSRS